MPLLDRDVGPDLEHLAPRCGTSPCRSASLAISRPATRRLPSFGAPCQCSATIAPLSSVLIPTRSSSDRSRRATKRGASASWPSREGSGRTSSSPGAAARSRGFRRRRVHRGRRPGARRGRDGRSGSRPARSARRACAGSDASSGTAASAGSDTIGAIVPSTSVSTADRSGCSRSGAIREVEPAVACAAFLCAAAIHALSIARHVPDPEAGGDRDGRRRLQRPARVGGGSVMVPLLIVWLGYGEREATGRA